MKKANAIIEYSVLIFLVVAALAGINYELKRHIQGFISNEAEEHIRKPIKFLWQLTYKKTEQSSTVNRYEWPGEGTLITSVQDNSVFTFTPPTSAPYIPALPLPVAGLHAQDPALPPPGQKQDGQKRQKNSERQNYES